MLKVSQLAGDKLPFLPRSDDPEAMLFPSCPGVWGGRVCINTTLSHRSAYCYFIFHNNVQPNNESLSGGNHGPSSPFMNSGYPRKQVLLFFPLFIF